MKMLPVANNIDTQKPLFNIIKKIIKNERNSTLIFNFSDGYFYKTDKYNGNSLSTLGLHASFSEENIYNRLKQIIFDDKINFRHQHIEC